MTKKDLVAEIVDARNEADRNYKKITGRCIDPSRGFQQVAMQTPYHKGCANTLYMAYGAYETLTDIIDQL